MSLITMSILSGRITIHHDKPVRVVIKRENGQRNVYKARKLIATIHDHRRNTSAQADWNVCWLNGRVDWHNTYTEARENALKA